jgi:hypothetical protein
MFAAVTPLPDSRGLIFNKALVLQSSFHLSLKLFSLGFKLIVLRSVEVKGVLTN